MEDKIDKQIVFDLINHVISKLNRHPFLKKQDMEEWMALISDWLYYKGIYVMPVGCGWCCETKKEYVKEYLDSHKDFFESYQEWCVKQR